MKRFSVRILNMIIGLVLYSLGIVITIKANIGYAPWEVFHAGLANTTGMSIGVASIVAGIVIAIIVTVSGEKLGLGTIASMILTGVFIDVILIVDIIPTAENLIAGIIMLIAGLFIISLGSYFYIKSAFGVGPRDNLMVVLARKTKLPIGLCRGIVELLVTFIGYILGGMAGIGTAISVIAIGSFIQITFRIFKFDATAVKHESLREYLYGFARQKKLDGVLIMIKGNKVELVPATLDDKQKVYDWCFNSETTKSHTGPPDYPENPISTREDFFDDYQDYYFTGSRPQDGRGFIIQYSGKPVGFISYASFHVKPHKSELDIWMNSEANCGQGFGTDAIVSLAEYLNKNLGVDELIMRPSAKNTRAIRSYAKAGFEASGTSPSDYLLDEYLSVYRDGDYGPGGDVLLVKRFDA